MPMHVLGPAPGDPAVVEQVLRALPAWFGIESAIVDYIAAAPALATWTAHHDDTVIGFLSVARLFPEAAEVHVMGVVPPNQRQGVGSQLLSSAERQLRDDGVRLLQVKTVSPALDYEPYALTRAFYESRGFLPLEDFPQLWGEGNPCRLYVKALD